MIRVACAVVFFEGKILVTQRAAHKNQPLLWEFPGGKIENGESPEECIVREIHEELDVQIRVKGALKPIEHDYETFGIQLFPFIAEIVSGSIKLSEHINFAWAKPEELKSFN